MSLIPPVIVEDDGLQIWMYFELHDRHKEPHIHVQFDNKDTVYTLDGEVLEGERLNGKRHRKLVTFIKENQEALNNLWHDFKDGNNTKDRQIFKL